MGTLEGFPNPPALWLRQAKLGYAYATRIAPPSDRARCHGERPRRAPGPSTGPRLRCGAGWTRGSRARVHTAARARPAPVGPRIRASWRWLNHAMAPMPAVARPRGRSATQASVGFSTTVRRPAMPCLRAVRSAAAATTGKAARWSLVARWSMRKPAIGSDQGRHGQRRRDRCAARKCKQDAGAQPGGSAELGQQGHWLVGVTQHRGAGHEPVAVPCHDAAVARRGEAEPVAGDDQSNRSNRRDHVGLLALLRAPRATLVRVRRVV